MHKKGFVLKQSYFCFRRWSINLETKVKLCINSATGCCNFQVPFDSDKDTTASCFSHDTSCFRCKSVSHLPKVWPHYYGWLNPSVIKGRVALFRNYANFPALADRVSLCSSDSSTAVELGSIIGHIWMPLLERLTFGRQKYPHSLIVHQNRPLETSFTVDSSGKTKQNKSGFSESTVQRWTGRRRSYIFQLCQQRV